MTKELTGRELTVGQKYRVTTSNAYYEIGTIITVKELKRGNVYPEEPSNTAGGIDYVKSTGARPIIYDYKLFETLTVEEVIESLEL